MGVEWTRGKDRPMKISPKPKPVPRPKRGKAPVRMPQRSEAVAGNEAKGITPIAAAQKKKPARK